MATLKKADAYIIADVRLGLGHWAKRLRASEAEADATNQMIAANSEADDMVEGLGDLRKIRFGLRNKGKSGGGRTIYLLTISNDVAALLTAYAKNEKSDLTPADPKAILGLLKEMEDGAN